MKHTRAPYPKTWDQGVPIEILQAYKGVCDYIVAGTKPTLGGASPSKPYLKDIGEALDPPRSKSTLCQMLQRLEAYYGLGPDALVIRSDHTGCELTREGEVVHKLATAAVDAQDRLKSSRGSLLRAAEEEGVTVRIGCPTLFNLHLLPWVYAQVRAGRGTRRKGAPAVEFQMQDGSRPAQLGRLRNGEYSIVIGPAGTVMDGLDFREGKCSPFRPHLLLPPPPTASDSRNPFADLRDARAVSVSVLANYPLCVSDNIEVLEALPPPVRSAGGSRDLVDTVLSVVNHVRSRTTLGVVFGWGSLFDEWRRHYGCEMRPLQGNVPEFRLGTYKRAGAGQSGAVRQVEDLIHEFLRLHLPP